MSTENAPSLAMQLGSTALALALVLALAWLALRALKKLQSRSTGGGNPMQVLRSAALGPRERLVTVRYRDREYLLGVATGGVNLIDSWPASEAAIGAQAPLSPPLP